MKQLQTVIGKFSYIHLKLPYYSFGIKQGQLTKKQTVLMASPEKALCDKIVTTSGIMLRSVKQTAELLMEDFRIERHLLRSLDSFAISGGLKMHRKKIVL